MEHKNGDEKTSPSRFPIYWNGAATSHSPKNDTDANTPPSTHFLPMKQWTSCSRCLCHRHPKYQQRSYVSRNLLRLAPGLVAKTKPQQVGNIATIQNARTRASSIAQSFLEALSAEAEEEASIAAASENEVVYRKMKAQRNRQRAAARRLWVEAYQKALEAELVRTDVLFKEILSEHPVPSANALLRVELQKRYAGSSCEVNDTAGAISVLQAGRNDKEPTSPSNRLAGSDAICEQHLNKNAEATIAVQGSSDFIQQQTAGLPENENKNSETPIHHEPEPVQPVETAETQDEYLDISWLDDFLDINTNFGC